MDENNQEVKSGGRKEIIISRKKFIVFLVVIFIIIAILVLARLFLVRSFNYGSINQMTTGQNVSDYIYNKGGYQDVAVESSQRAPYYNNDQLSITDTREFLKTSYRGDIQTRDVASQITNIKNIVKGSDGRIDSLNSSPKSGYVRFVVPKSNFDNFKDEIEKLTHRKLYTETINSENLLGQKISIEEQIIETESILLNLKNQKETLLNNHTNKVTSINKEIARIKAELIAIRAVIAVTVDQDTLTALKKQESSLVSQQANQNKLLNTENNTYNNQNQNLENQINNTNNNLAQINKSEDKFLDNIETVNGQINVNFISFWDMAKTFSPIHPTFIMIILLLILWIILKKTTNIIPKVILR